MGVSAGNVLKFLDSAGGPGLATARSTQTDTESITAVSSGAQIVAPQLYTWSPDLASWTRPHSGRADTETQTYETAGTIFKVLSRLYADNGESFDRVRSASKSNLLAEAGASSARGSLSVTKRGEWFIDHYPALGVRATAVKAAGGVGFIHVITGAFGFFLDTAAGAAEQVLNISTGQATNTTINIPLYIPAAGQASFYINNLSLPADDNTAVSISFGAAGSPTSRQMVFMTGYTIK